MDKLEPTGGSDKDKTEEKMFRELILEALEEVEEALDSANPLAHEKKSKDLIRQAVNMRKKATGKHYIKVNHLV